MGDAFGFFLYIFLWVSIILTTTIIAPFVNIPSAVTSYFSPYPWKAYSFDEVKIQYSETEFQYKTKEECLQKLSDYKDRNSAYCGYKCRYNFSGGYYQCKETHPELSTGKKL